jgi:hypothetical protein
MSQPIQQLDFEFTFSDIANKAFEHIGNTIRFTQFLHHNSIAVMDYRETPLPTDELPFIIGGIKSENLFTEDLRRLSINWLNQKAFEEFVAAILICLEEANKFLHFIKAAEDSKVKPIASVEEAEKLKKSIATKAKKAHLPVHIEQIEKLLKYQLELKEEISSINNARNCLVHRNGIVHEVDFNDKSTPCLRLKWVEFYHELQLMNGDWKKLTFELRREGVEAKNLRITPVPKELCFSENDITEYDINTIIGVGWTCIFFINSLYCRIFHSIKDQYPLRFTEQR